MVMGCRRQQPGFADVNCDRAALGVDCRFLRFLLSHERHSRYKRRTESQAEAPIKESRSGC